MADSDLGNACAGFAAEVLDELRAIARLEADAIWEGLRAVLKHGP